MAIASAIAARPESAGDHHRHPGRLEDVVGTDQETGIAGPGRNALVLVENPLLSVQVNRSRPLVVAVVSLERPAFAVEHFKRLLAV